MPKWFKYTTTINLYYLSRSAGALQDIYNNATSVITTSRRYRSCEGEPATFKSQRDAPLTYQWQKNNVNIPGPHFNATIQSVASTDVGDAVIVERAEILPVRWRHFHVVNTKPVAEIITPFAGQRTSLALK
jgi:hypothetical protein